MKKNEQRNLREETITLRITISLRFIGFSIKKNKF